MQPLRLNVRTLTLRTLPADEASTAKPLVDLLVANVRPGNQPRPVAVSVRGLRVDLVTLQPVFERKLNLGWFMAGSTRARWSGVDPLDCIGLMGVFTNREGIRFAMVFLEWADCRWWQWRALIDADGNLMSETATTSSALDGDALPNGVGRWWSLGRRANLSFNVAPTEPPRLPVQEAALVH